MTVFTVQGASNTNMFTVLLPYWETFGEVLQLSYKSLFLTVPSDSMVIFDRLSLESPPNMRYVVSLVDFEDCNTRCGWLNAV